MSQSVGTQYSSKAEQPGQAMQIDLSTLVAAIQALTMNIGLSAKALTTIANALSTLA